MACSCILNWSKYSTKERNVARTEIDFASNPLTEVYGCNSFSDAVMRERLPKSIYKAVKKVQAGEAELSLK